MQSKNIELICHTVMQDMYQINGYQERGDEEGHLEPRFPGPLSLLPDSSSSQTKTLSFCVAMYPLPSENTGV